MLGARGSSRLSPYFQRLKSKRWVSTLEFGFERKVSLTINSIIMAMA